MPLPILQRWTAWLCLLAALITGSLPGSGLILCVGDDGHVAIEAAASVTQSACFDCTSEATLPGCCSIPEGGPSDCSCSDFPILTSVADAEWSVPERGTVLVPPACVLVGVDGPSPLRPARDLDLQDRVALPPCPRVPALLILRV